MAYSRSWSYRVSIHAFREGRRLDIKSTYRSILVSIHAFREGRRRVYVDIKNTYKRFNPRLPRGKATTGVNVTERRHQVSIHAFREGRRPILISSNPCQQRFQSTPSAREGDERGSRSSCCIRRFNPRLPRGKATSTSPCFFTLPCFNPRLPRGKATGSSSAEPMT